MHKQERFSVVRTRCQQSFVCPRAIQRPAWMKMGSLVAVLVSSIAVSPRVQATDVQPGIDLWQTPAGSTSDEFNSAAGGQAIPADFFGPGSDPFDGTIGLQGKPLPSGNGPCIAPADTIVERLAPALLPNPPVCPVSDTIPIEIVALSLVSSQPITVTYNGGLNPELWDIDICLSDVGQQLGQMMINHDCPDGGTYNSSLPVQAKFIFRRQSDGDVRVFDTGVEGHAPVRFNASDMWVHTPNVVGSQIVQVPAGTEVDSNCDGSIDKILPGTSNFVPGIGLFPCGCGDCEGCSQQFKELTSEQAQLAAHGVLPAQDPPDSDGDGIPDACEGQTILDNWVIADDWSVGCDKCQCDVDGNSTCDNADLLFVITCQGTPTPAGCQNADLDCDGDVDVQDVTTADCLFVGRTDCCDTKINRVKWYGSYFDPDFEPSPTGPPIREVDSWLLAIHSDIPPQACPPVPAGRKPVDLCGQLTACPLGAGLLFTPDGSSNTYLLAGNVGTFGAGDRVRICGYTPSVVVPNCPTQVTGSIWVNSALDCSTKVSRPDRLLAQWAIPPSLVSRNDVFKTGCDGHRIFEYAANLPDGCLLHDFSGGSVDVNGQFHAVNGRTYWLSIQAAVGHAITTGPGGTCIESPTGQDVNAEFWGWHTTPPGFQHKDDAYMGRLVMAMNPPDQNLCDHSWVYEWMSHLHCSQPEYRDCCDDPTKSIDMAFYLLNATPGSCDNTGLPCQTDADCGICDNDPAVGCAVNGDCPPGGTCVPGSCLSASEQVHWCQPVNPTVAVSAVPNPLPGGGIDEYQDTQALVTVNLQGQPTTELFLTGPTTVVRSDPQTDDATGDRTIETEILSMSLTGASPFGPATLRLNPQQDSRGQAVQGGGGGGGGTFAVDSFFDVFVEISFVDAGLTLHSAGPVRLEAQLDSVPPTNVSFQTPVGTVVDLLDEFGQTVGQIKFVDHFIPYRGGVNIHSDIDWVKASQVDCCEPLPATPIALACDPVVCPDTTQECIPTSYRRVLLGSCSSDGAICRTDADCSGLGLCGAPFTIDWEVEACECQDPNLCRGIRVAPPPPAIPTVECINSCPPGMICVRTELDTDGDGIVDVIKCRCEKDLDPLGACCRAIGVCDNTVQSDCPTPPDMFFPGQMCTGDAACCLPDGTCADLDPICCADQGGISHPGQLCSGTLEACCFDDGSCQDLDAICCQDLGGTPGGTGSACANADNNMNGIDDGCEAACDIDAVANDCIGVCPNPGEGCEVRCLNVNPATGLATVTACDCIGPFTCHVDFGGGAAVAGAGTGNPCVVADTGGTVKLPPAGCEYLSPDEVHEIINGLGGGATIELAAIHKDFICRKGAGTCSVPMPADCDTPGGNLGGEIECFDSNLALTVQGTGSLSTFARTITLGQVQCEVHTGPRNPGDPVQDFDTEMVMLQGTLPPGDPDFCLLRVTAGSSVGLPSPGHTTLSKLPGGDFQVDSFFDITYQIEFQGCVGGALDGLGGTTQGTVRVTTGGLPDCVGACGLDEVCVKTSTVNADGTITICCDCQLVTGACCRQDGTCVSGVTQSQCSGVADTFFPNQSCLGTVACCLPDGSCQNMDQLCCEDAGGSPFAGVTCSGTTEACCFGDNTCQDLDPLCCQDQGGTPQGPNTDCANTSCVVDCEPNTAQTDCATNVCPTDPALACEPKCVITDPLTGITFVDFCDCVGVGECYVQLSAAGGAVAAGPGGPCTIVDNGSGTINLPPEGCEYLSPEEVHEILDAFPGSNIELAAIHKDFICNEQTDSFPGCPPPGVVCEGDGGDLGGKVDCFESKLELQITGTGGLAGFNRLITVPNVRTRVDTSPRVEGDAVQTFANEMVALDGQLVPNTDPDFCQLRITAGSMFGLPSSGQTTLTRLGPPGSQWQVDSFFDITYRIDYTGCPGSALTGASGSATGTLRMATGIPPCKGNCPAGQVCDREQILNPDGTISTCCNCIDAVCEPLPDGTGCHDAACAVVGELCIPQKIVCTNGGCRVVECGCDAADECHVELPPVGTTEPVCTGPCPPGRKCVLIGKDIDGDGTKDEFICKCIPKPIIADDTCWADDVNMGTACQKDSDCPAGQVCGSKSRHISFIPAPTPELVAYRVEIVASTDFPGSVGNTYWVGDPIMYSEGPTGGQYTGGKLQCATPAARDWSGDGLIDAWGEPVVPNALYEIRTVCAECLAAGADVSCMSDPATIETQKWADVVAPYDNALQPDFGDIGAEVDKFKSKPGAPRKARALLCGELLDPTLNVGFDQISAAVGGFKGKTYQQTCTDPTPVGPQPCP